MISLGVGDPDVPTPAHIVEAMREAVADPATHRYPSYYGLPELRRAVADWYGARFGVELDPETEVQPLIGSKEGIGHIALAFVDPGDEALIPDPGYPVYGGRRGSPAGRRCSLPSRADAGFLPDLGRGAGRASGRRLLWLEVPEQPDRRGGGVDDVREAVAFAPRARPAPAPRRRVLGDDLRRLRRAARAAGRGRQGRGGRVRLGVEDVQHDRLADRVGGRNAEAIRALATVKTNIDSGMFTAIQRAAIAALTARWITWTSSRATYQRRRDLSSGR